VLDRISDKWTALIVLVLRDGSLRFSHLRGRVGGVAPKVLTETLRRLERDGLLTRTAYAEVPPRVEYELTALATHFRSRSRRSPRGPRGTCARSRGTRALRPARGVISAHGVTMSMKAFGTRPF